MSLLDHGREVVTVYPEVTEVDRDGNIRTRPSDNGFQVRASIQVLGQSGTSSRRQEQDNEGYEGERVYKIRFPRSFNTILGAQSRIEWNGEQWAVFGDVNRYNASAATAHHVYTIKRY